MSESNSRDSDGVESSISVVFSCDRNKRHFPSQRGRGGCERKKDLEMQKLMGFVLNFRWLCDSSEKLPGSESLSGNSHKKIKSKKGVCFVAIPGNKVADSPWHVFPAHFCENCSAEQGKPHQQIPHKNQPKLANASFILPPGQPRRAWRSPTSYLPGPLQTTPSSPFLSLCAPH